MRIALSRVDRESFTQLSWAVWGLQQDEPNSIAQQIISFPREALTSEMSSGWAVRPWEVETLINLLVETQRDRGALQVSCSRFEVMGDFINQLRTLEDTEAGSYLDDLNIQNEMHRIGQRQFPFQRGFLNSADFYRSLYLYGQGICAGAFERSYGLSVSDFTKAGFALFSQFNRQPVVSMLPDYTSIDLSPEITQRAIDLMTVDEVTAGDDLRALLTQLDARGQPIAYRPSLLRRRPIIRFGGVNGRLRAPLPNLIALRISVGLYYDMLQGGRPVRDAIARQFELYCLRFLSHTMPELNVEPEYRYRRSGAGNQVDSPDILASENGRLALVIECKATKLTFGAQFAGDPALAAPDKYEELAKGVFQLWRFFSHCRRGMTRHSVDDTTFALLLTVDAWLTMSRSLQEHVIARAVELATADGGIIDEDRRPVVFAAIQDFERLILGADLAGLKAALAAANEDRFLGWLLPDIGHTLVGQDQDHRAYPFELSELLPWWKAMQEERQARSPT